MPPLNYVHGDSSLLTLHLTLYSCQTMSRIVPTHSSNVFLHPLKYNLRTKIADIINVHKSMNFCELNPPMKPAPRLRDSITGSPGGPPSSRLRSPPPKVITVLISNEIVWFRSFSNFIIRHLTICVILCLASFTRYYVYETRACCVELYVVYLFAS